MDNILVPVTVGAALVIIVDFIRRFAPNATPESLKLLTVVLSIMLATAVLAAQGNPNVQKLLEDGLLVLGTSQALYGLVWKDTAVHENIVAPAK